MSQATLSQTNVSLRSLNWGGHDVHCYMGERLKLRGKTTTLHCTHWRPKANSKGRTRRRSGMGNRGPTTAAPAMPFLPCAANNSGEAEAILSRPPCAMASSRRELPEAAACSSANDELAARTPLSICAFNGYEDTGGRGDSTFATELAVFTARVTGSGWGRERPGHFER